MSIVGSTPPSGRRIRSSTPPPRRLPRNLDHLTSPTHSLQNQSVSSISSCQDPNPCPHPATSARYQPLRSKRQDSTTDDEDDDDNENSFFDDRADDESTALVTAAVSSPVTKRREAGEVRRREGADLKRREGGEAKRKEWGETKRKEGAEAKAKEGQKTREEDFLRKDICRTEDRGSLKGRRKIEDWFGKSEKMMVDALGEEGSEEVFINEPGRGGGGEDSGGSRRGDLEKRRGEGNERVLRASPRQVSLDSGEPLMTSDRGEESIHPPSYHTIFKENIGSGRHGPPVSGHCSGEAGSFGSGGGGRETTTTTAGTPGTFPRRPQHRHRLVRQLSDAVSVATIPSPCLPRSDSVKFCRAAANGNAQRSHGLACASGVSLAGGAMAGSNPAGGAGGGGGSEYSRAPRRVPSLKLKRLHVQQNSRAGVPGTDARGGGGGGGEGDTGVGVGVSDGGGLGGTCSEGNTGDSAPGTGKLQSSTGGGGASTNLSAPPTSGHVNPSITITFDSDSDSVYSDYLSPEINYRNNHQDQRVKFLGETHSSLYGSPVREEHLSPGGESGSGNNNNGNGNGVGPESGATKVSSTTSYLKEQIMNFFQPSDNKLAMKLFGNKHALIKEKMRHKRVGNWVIHPCSNFR